jgi:hypothetical protein
LFGKSSPDYRILIFKDRGEGPRRELTAENVFWKIAERLTEKITEKERAKIEQGVEEVEAQPQVKKSQKEKNAEIINKLVFSHQGKNIEKFLTKLGRMVPGLLVVKVPSISGETINWGSEYLTFGKTQRPFRPLPGSSDEKLQQQIYCALGQECDPKKVKANVTLLIIYSLMKIPSQLVSF